MKKFIHFSGVIILLILILPLGVNPTWAEEDRDHITPSQITSEANFPWSSQYVQQDLVTPLDVGKYVSIALRPFDDVPSMSYYDETNGNLLIAIPAGSQAGNCGTDNNWICIPLDGTVDSEDVGKYSSIDVWGTAEDWRLGISYYDATNHGLKAIFLACSFTTCLPPHIVKIYYPYWFSQLYGLYTSVKFNSGGVASIAFYTYSDIATEWLMYAYPVAGDGNCGLGDDIHLWQCDGIDYGELVGQYTSLDISWDDQPYIAYYDGTGGNLKLARFTGNGNCGPVDTWQCDLIDGVDGNDVGKFASLIAPQSDGAAIRIAYYDQTNEHLMYFSDSGLKMIVDEMGSSLQPMGVSMTLDKDDLPVIAYQQIASEYSHPVLRLARLYYTYHDLPSGNCGEEPPGYSIQIWHCDTLDNAGQYTSEANFVSADVDSHGRVRVSYTEDVPESYATSLKFIYQTFFHTFLPVLSNH